MSDTDGVREAATAQARLTLVVACITAFVVNANTSAVAILIPQMSEDTGSSTAYLQWAITGYSLVGAAVIVTSGALGDVFGRRRIFLGGVVLFVISCAFIALSTGGQGIVWGRVIQGAAGSTILACGMSLLSVTASGKAQVRAVSLWGAASGAGAAAGPLVGGLLVNFTGWQGLFWIDAAIAAVCIPLTLMWVAESRDPARPRSIDWTGSVLVAAILAPLILVLSKASDWGWLSGASLLCFGISIVSTVLFFVVEGRVAAPLVDLALLRNRTLISVTLVILVGAGALNGLMYVVSLYFQDPDALNMTALQAGLATLPAAAGAVVVSVFVAKLAEKIGARDAIVLGLVVMSAGFVGTIFTQASWGYLPFVLPLLAIAMGMGLSNGVASSLATSCVDEAEVGSASGISNMARYVGAAVATAAVAAVYSSTTANQVADGASRADALATAMSRSSLLLALVSAGFVLAGVFAGARRAKRASAADYAAHAAATTHTLPLAPRD